MLHTLLISRAAVSEEPTASQPLPSEVERVADFLSTNVIGRVVETSATPKVNGKLDSEFFRRTLYTNLEVNDE
jgi:hypothetical protein